METSGNTAQLYALFLQSTGCIRMEAYIIKQLLRWTGHVIRMPENRLPRQLLYGELCNGHRDRGGPKRRFKDHLKISLKRCGISPSNLETLASVRTGWHDTCSSGINHFEEEGSLPAPERPSVNGVITSGPGSHFPPELESCAPLVAEDVLLNLASEVT